MIICRGCDTRIKGRTTRGGSDIVNTHDLRLHDTRGNRLTHWLDRDHSIEIFVFGKAQRITRLTQM